MRAARSSTSPSEEDLVARCQGGPNAATIIIGDEKFVLHLVAGALREGKSSPGCGVVIDPRRFAEIATRPAGHQIAPPPCRPRAHVILPTTGCWKAPASKCIRIGTTRRGIGPATCKAALGVRVVDLLGARLRELIALNLADVSSRLGRAGIADTELDLATSSIDPALGERRPLAPMSRR
jgi:adenylosuccinate synthase